MIVIFVSSLNENMKLATILHEQLKSLDKESRIINLVELDLPLYTSYKEEHEGIPEIIHTLTAQMQEAQGYIFVTPEYNYSIPPMLTNAIAWISRSHPDFRSNFSNRVIQLATHSGSAGSDVMNAMRTQFIRLGAVVMPREIITHYKAPLELEHSQRILHTFVTFINTHS